MLSLHPFVSGSTGLGDVFKSLTKSWKSSSTKKPSAQAASSSTGGNVTQKQLCDQLKNGELSERASAAAHLAETLKKYSVSSSMEIWLLARDLVNKNRQTYIRRNGLELLIECIISDKSSSVGNMLLYFNDIVSFCDILDNSIDSAFDLFLIALIKLTDDAREISNLIIYDKERNLMKFLDSCLSSMQSILSSSSKASISEKGRVLKFDRDLILFLIRCVISNQHSFKGPLIDSMILRLISMCIDVSDADLLSLCLKFLHAVIHSGILNAKSLDSVLRFLCLKYDTSEDDNVFIWELIIHISREFGAQIAIIQLCDILKSATESSISSATNLKNRYENKKGNGPSENELRLSCNVIRILHELNYNLAQDEHYIIDFSYFTILAACNVVLMLKNPKLTLTFLQSFNRMIANDYVSISPSLPFERLMPFRLWYSNNLSIFNVLLIIHLSSPECFQEWSDLCDKLQVLFKSHELIAPQDKLVDTFLKNHEYISEECCLFVLGYFAEEKLCTVMNSFWKENCCKLLNCFYYSERDVANSRYLYHSSSRVKNETLNILFEAFCISNLIQDEQVVQYDILLEIFRRSVKSTDAENLTYLGGVFLEKCLVSFPYTFCKDVCDIFQLTLVVRQNTERLRSIVSISSFASSTHSSSFQVISSGSFLNAISETLCKVFIQCSIRSSKKSARIYNLLINLFQHAIDTENTDVLLAISKCLIRIRVNSGHYIFFTSPADMTGLSAALYRNVHEFNFDDTKPYKWVYPEDYPHLPAQMLNVPSKDLKLYNVKSMKLDIEEDNIDITYWFNLVLHIFDKFVDWEVYSYIWAHFCSQLSNMKLFSNCLELTQALRKITCDQLMLNLPTKLSLPTEVTKADLQVVFVRTLSSLLAYNKNASKLEQDDIIKALVYGLSSWEKTAIPCINILTVCCYEIPQSIKKYLSVILTKLQTRVTSAIATSFTLEFLLSLTEIPVLTTNFTADEFKTVFAVAFKYIQYASDIRDRRQTSRNTGSIQMHGVDAAIEETPTTQMTEITPILAEYISSLSYKVIVSWYLKISVKERKNFSSFIIRNLILLNKNSNQLDEQTLAFIDLIMRFTYSNNALKFKHPNSIQKHLETRSDGMRVEAASSVSSWIIGHSVLSIDTYENSPSAFLTFRRPTDTYVLQVEFEDYKNDDLPNGTGMYHMVDSQPMLDANHIILQLFDHLNLSGRDKPMPLFSDAVTMRAISSLDRIPVVEFHKIGIIYIGPGQVEESEILSNRAGSPEYHRFINAVGQPVRLSRCKDIYTGGLDTEGGIDGQYTLVWSDEIMQVVFHTATMMSLDDIHEAELKKRHIGNNHVNIYFDESGFDFNFNVIKSQFNFINIVITPHTQPSAQYLGDSESGYTGPGKDNFYKVRAYRRLGVPGVFAGSHFKILSEELVASFVRNLAITADSFASVWHASSSAAARSNWALRARQICDLREKTLAMHSASKTDYNRSAASSSTPIAPSTTVNATQSFLEQLLLDSPSSSPQSTHSNHSDPSDISRYLR